MAYFDSPKNKALWEKELVSLRQERQSRIDHGYEPHAKKNKEMDAGESPFRKKITFEELQKIVEETEGYRKVKRPTRAKTT